MYERTYNSRVLKTDKEPIKKKRFPWKRALIIFCAVLVLFGIVVLIKTPRFQVRTINVIGTNVADPADISTYALGSLEGYYAWILPKTSIFLVTPEKMSDAIKRAFPRLQNVVVDREGGQALRVVVEEYPGVYLWCDSACSFMDAQGVVFADAPYFSGSAYLKVLIGTRADYPFTPTTPEQMRMIETLKEKLTEIDIVPLSIRFDSANKLTVTFMHHTHEAELYIDPREEIDVSLETLYSGLRTETVSKLYNDEKITLEYLDVRFANKLIYKFN